jgi:hypothetical protein
VRKQLGEAHWEVFCNGDEEAWQAVWAETWSNAVEHDAGERELPEVSQPPRVCEVSDSGALPTSGYLPARDELEVLARHWAMEWLDVEVFFFLTGQSGSTEIRVQLHAAERLKALRAVLGEEAVEGAIADEKAVVRKRLGEEHWEVYRNGDEAARAAVREEFQLLPPDADAELEGT